MARRTIEQELADLATLRDQGPGPATTAALRKALAGRSNHVAARAAEIVRTLGIGDLAPELIAAFHRFMKPGSDKGCSAKTQAVSSLVELASVQADAVTVYTAAISHRQPEPVFGGTTDVAVDLRGIAALGLVQLNVPDVMERLADLLADEELQARAAAARAIGASTRLDGLPLLRLRLRIGDDPEVMGECCAALLQIADEQALPLVREYLMSDDEAIAEAAALALGQSRHAAAFAPLEDAWERSMSRPLRQTLMLAMAMLRHDAATQWLLDEIRDGTEPAARAAITALAIHRYDPAVRSAVEAAAAQRGRDHLQSDIQGAFEA